MNITRSLVSFFVALILLSCNKQSETVASKCSGDIKRIYITPKQVIWQSKNAEIINVERLLNESNHQANTVNKDLCLLQNKNEHAAIILDFGKELHGGLEIITGMWEGKEPINVRIRFGESVSEAMSEISISTGATNDHAIRDWNIKLPWCGKIEIGNTGFRFVRIDLLDDNVTLHLREINAISIMRDIPYLGSFKSNDELLNKIWETGAYTVHLNMQEFLWDGIKRDRLVWIGDMHPEVKTINSVFGYNEVVPKSLDYVRDITPVNEWMNGISSYSMWWILIHKEWYTNNGNLEYLKEQESYLSELLKKFCSMIDKDGQEHLDGGRFLDWPSSPYPDAVNAGYHALLKMTMEAGDELCTVLGNTETAELCRSKAKLLEKRIPDHVNSKQAAALLSLSNIISAEKGNAVIANEGAKHFSTFYGYYMLLAMAKAENYTGAMNIIREYWGGMLHLGATTFWEDFDVEWMNNAGRIDELPVSGKVDVHSSYGDYCYKGVRHSFCHGWASGPTSWLSEFVLGIKILEPGCKKVAVQPNLGDLEWVEGSYPTPYGVIKVRHEKTVNGEIKSTISAPKEVEIVKI